MPTTSAAAIAAIEQVDRLLDANHVALQMRLWLKLSVTGHGLDIYAWHNAYERCPDLRIRRDALYRQRGRLQLERDAAINREYAAEQRSARARNRKPAPISAETAITLRVGGAYMQRTKLGAFLADNADGDLDFPAIKSALEVGTVFRGGGGAAPEWSVEIAS